MTGFIAYNSLNTTTWSLFSLYCGITWCLAGVAASHDLQQSAVIHVIKVAGVILLGLSVLGGALGGLTVAVQGGAGGLDSLALLVDRARAGPHLSSALQIPLVGMGHTARAQVLEVDSGVMHATGNLVMSLLQLLHDGINLVLLDTIGFYPLSYCLAFLVPKIQNNYEMN